MDNPWRTLPEESPAAECCAATAARLRRPDPHPQAPPALPADIGRTPSGTATTQAALGRALLDLTREAPESAKHVVTVSPDVSSTTDLGGWVNKVGVWSTADRPDWFADDAETILHWREKSAGQHIELGIAEVNLVSLLGELGATWSRWGQPLLPIGWILRSAVVWHKPHAMPTPIQDRLATRHEMIFLFVTQPDYYFNLDPVRSVTIRIACRGR